MIQERILQYIEYKGLSKYAFYKKTGLSNGFLDKRGAIGSDKCEIIFYHYPEINPEWLLTGKGSMLRSSDKGSVFNEDHANYSVSIDSYPLLSMEAFAGYGDVGVSGEELARITERYEIPLFRGLHVDFMISVKGSSMYPKYNSGDVVACRIIKELIFIQWNKVYVIDTYSQGVILKRLKPADDANNVICKSDNDSYNAFELPKSEIRHIAMVVGVVRLE